VGVLQGQLARQLEVEPDLDAAVDRHHPHVVHLAHPRDGQRRCVHPVAQRRFGSRLDVDDHVAPRERLLHRPLDLVRCRMALTHGSTGWDADDDVGEVTAG
jgi:hypothetical protein